MNHLSLTNTTKINLVSILFAKHQIYLPGICKQVHPKLTRPEKQKQNHSHTTEQSKIDEVRKDGETRKASPESIVAMVIFYILKSDLFFTKYFCLPSRWQNYEYCSPTKWVTKLDTDLYKALTIEQCCNVAKKQQVQEVLTLLVVS